MAIIANTAIASIIAGATTASILMERSI